MQFKKIFLNESLPEYWDQESQGQKFFEAAKIFSQVSSEHRNNFWDLRIWQNL